MELVVPGAPRSANAGARSRRRWRERVARAARERLAEEDAPAEPDLSVLIIYFYQGETVLDIDNIAKSLLDGVKGILFADDRQASELLVRKTRLSAGLSLIGASPYLLESIERMTLMASDFVYIRIEPAPDHGRIP